MSIYKYGYVHFWGFLPTVRFHTLLSITEMVVWNDWVYISWLLFSLCTKKCDGLWIKITCNLKTCWKNLGPKFTDINAVASNQYYESWYEGFQILYNVELNIKIGISWWSCTYGRTNTMFPFLSKKCGISHSYFHVILWSKTQTWGWWVPKINWEVRVIFYINIWGALEISLGINHPMNNRKIYKK